MSNIEKILERMRNEPSSIRFTELARICEEHFGKPRQSGSSHMVFKTPWQGDPRVNIQNDKGKAKTYQVKQVLAAVDKMQKGKQS